MQIYSSSFGSVYKSMRQNKQLTIAAVRGSMSTATVSRFENGKADISLVNFIYLLNRLGIDIDEFFTIWAKSQPSNELVLFSQREFFFTLDEISKNNDELTAQTLLSVLNHSTDQNKTRELKIMMVKAAQLRFNNQGGHLTLAESRAITQFLLMKTKWYAFEYRLLSNTLDTLQKSDIDLLYDHLIMTHFSRMNKDRRPLDFAGILVNFGVRFVNHRQISQAQGICELLQSISIPETKLYLRLHVILLTLVTRILSANQSTDPQVMQLNKILGVLKTIAPDTAKKEAEWIKSLSVN